MKADNMKRAGVLVTMGALAMMALVTGCASQQPTVQVPEGLKRDSVPIQLVPDAPRWTYEKGEAFRGEKNRALYGVGLAAGSRHPTLRRKAAEGQARNDLASTMGSYVASLQKQFLAETTADSMDKASVESHVSDTMKILTEQSLVGAQIIQYYERPDINEAYALARLDFDQIKSMMEKLAASSGQFKQLDAKMRDWIRKNAETANDQLNEELQKKNQK
jgi:hypothetical protein